MDFQQEPLTAPEAAQTTQLILGTRRSKLARVQTDLVAAAIQSHHASSSSTTTTTTTRSISASKTTATETDNAEHRPSLEIKIHAMDPLGDRDKTTALYKLSDGTAAKSLWTGELEELLARRELHAIVHSLKDMPTSLPDGLVLAAVLEREDPRDALVLRRSNDGGAESSSSSSSSSAETQEQKQKQRRSAREILQSLPEGSVVGTSSLRRMAQLRRRYPRLRYEVVRGNVPTRLRKLDAPEEFEHSPEYAALILAAAGLIRLELGGRIDAFLASGEEEGNVLHAVGQGAIGIEARGDDEATLELLKSISHRQTWLAILSERALLRKLEGGCSVPIGVETRWTAEEMLELRAVVASVDGQTAVEAQGSMQVIGDADAEQLGSRLAQELVDSGASKILDEINEERRRERERETAQQSKEHAISTGIV